MVITRSVALVPTLAVTLSMDPHSTGLDQLNQVHACNCLHPAISVQLYHSTLVVRYVVCIGWSSLYYPGAIKQHSVIDLLCIAGLRAFCHICIIFAAAACWGESFRTQVLKVAMNAGASVLSDTTNVPIHVYESIIFNSPYTLSEALGQVHAHSSTQLVLIQVYL